MEGREGEGGKRRRSRTPLDEVEIEFELPGGEDRRRSAPPRLDELLERDAEQAPESDPPSSPSSDQGEPVEETQTGGRSARHRSRRGPGETISRILWAIPLIAFAVAIIVAGGLVFAAAMALFAVLGLAELFAMARDSRPLGAVAFVAAVGLIAAAYFGDHMHIVIVGVAMFPVMFVFALGRGIGPGLTASLAVTVFGLVWVGLPFAHAVLLREIPDHGAGLLVNVLVATFVADTAAYLGGRMFGRHRLAPSISPNKTLEGLAFGFVGGAMGFWFAGLYQDWLSGTDALLMGMAVAAIAPLGDLFESAIKRDLGVKDSGAAFGPHGGVLDRLDAVLFTIVVGYYLALAFGYG